MANNNSLWFTFFNNTPLNLPSKKDEIIRHAFNISSEESLFRVYQSNGINEKPILVITECAIYFSDIRWNLNNICKFVIFNDKNTCYIFKSLQVEYTLFQYPIKSIDDSQNDPLTQIISMQKYFYEHSQSAKKDRKNIFSHIGKSALAKLQNNKSLSHKEVLLLESFFSEEDYIVFSGEILLKNDIINGNIPSILFHTKVMSKKYDSAKLELWISEKIALLKNQLLADPSLIISNPYRFDSTTSFCDSQVFQQTLQSQYEVINLIINIKNHTFCSLTDLMTHLKRINICKTDQEKLISLWYTHSIEKYDHLLTLIGEGFVGDILKYKTSIDSYGLSIYHYAIITNNAYILNSVSSIKDIPVICQEEGSSLSILFDPLFVSLYTKNDSLFESLIKKQADYLALCRNIETIKRKIHLAQNANTISSEINNVLHKNYDERRHIDSKEIEKYEKYVEQLRSDIKHGKSLDYTKWINANEILTQLKLRYQEQEHRKKSISPSILSSNIKKYIDFLNEELSETMLECEKLLQSYREKYHEYIHYFDNETNPFIKIILEIYSDYKCRYKYTSKIKDEDILITNFDGICFVINKEWYYSHLKNDNNASSSTHNSSDYHHEQANRQSSQRFSQQFKKKKSLKDIKKPYGKNWFSPKAYSDLTILKKEYRKLATKYHPDSADGSSEIFIDIQNEKDLIIENLKG